MYYIKSLEHNLILSLVNAHLENAPEDEVAQGLKEKMQGPIAIKPAKPSLQDGGPMHAAFLRGGQ